jgi:formate-dependent nitrite reductase cytochrome c552 subunit
VAQQHCKDLYNLVYRPLSADGTHSTIDSMNRHFEADVQMNITALRVAPDVSDTAEIIDTLNFACLIFLWAVEPFVRSFERGGDADRLQRYLECFRELEPNIGLGI